MELTKISSKGQIVIPLKIRNELGIKEGSAIVVERVNDMVVMKKVDIELVNKFRRGLEDLKAGRVRRVA